MGLGVVLGTGARTALKTYTDLRDDERQEQQAKRQEELLGIQKSQEGRAQTEFDRRMSEQRDADAAAASLYNSTPATRTAIKADVAGPSVNNPTTAAAPAKVEGIAAPATSGAEVGSAPPPTGTGYRPTTAAGAKVLREARRDEAEIAQRNAALANDRTRLDLEKAESALRQKISAHTLSDKEYETAQRTYNDKIKQNQQFVNALPQDDSIVASDPSQTTAVEAALNGYTSAYEYAPDGRTATWTKAKDGTGYVVSVMGKDGKPQQQIPVRTVGDVRKMNEFALALADPTNYSRYTAQGMLVEARKTADSAEEIKDLDIVQKMIMEAPHRDPTEQELATMRKLELRNPDKYMSKVQEESIDQATGEKLKVTKEVSRFSQALKMATPQRQVVMGGQTTTLDAVAQSIVSKAKVRSPEQIPSAIAGAEQLAAQQGITKAQFNRYMRPMLEQGFMALAGKPTTPAAPAPPRAALPNHTNPRAPGFTPLQPGQAMPNYTNPRAPNYVRPQN